MYILIGPRTYSSAVLFANVVHTFQFGTIVGEGGAARINQSGGVQSIRLPQSGLMMWWPRLILTNPAGGGKGIYLAGGSVPGHLKAVLLKAKSNSFDLIGPKSR